MEEEGVIKFTLHHQEGPLPSFAVERTRDLLAWRRLLIQLGAVGREVGRYGGAGFGNLSARVPPYPGERGRRAFVITGSQTSHSDPCSPAPLCVVDRYDPGRNTVTSRGPVPPSSESMTHGALYDLSPRVRFVFHGHVPLLWQNARALGLPTTSASVPYGTPQMAMEVARLYRETNLSEVGVLAMGGHEDGIITFGYTAEEAGGVLVRTLARGYGLQLVSPQAPWKTP